MWINVTQKHIDLADKALGSRHLRSSICPVAQALKEVFGEDIWAGSIYIRFKHHYDDVEFILLDMPDIASEFINNYDMRLNPKPFKFWLPLS